MNSEELRSRMAHLEAQDRQQPHNGWDREPTDSFYGDGEAWPWHFLFESPESAAGGKGRNQQPFALNRWLAEGLRGLQGYLHDAGLDEEFWRHLEAAERELLLAWRSLIDARLRRWEERSRNSAPDPGRRQSIDVEFE